MLFSKLRAKWASARQLPQLEPVDHTLAEAALEHAVDAHRAAQEQRAEATQVVTNLREVNIRNGFAPAIEAQIMRKLGGAT
ncbi:hypothetical protein SAMN04487912_102337 [Arthrobacter sp. cf158]|uniref:DUF7620 family protein n=1 Tax=Arthrobacter sp. cf158 TaxID=1761744 RepID=UPI0008977FBA|nr:hypothetical protein [Arthrobacter sp. cf158]SDW32671.1 hypothetical protein SAMN04487912_102337 [Arthrobacter sp. cf158]